MLDHKSQRHSFRILLALLCFCLQIPGTYASGLLRLDPPSIVVRFGSSASANCTTNVTHEGMGWEASQGSVDMNEHVQLITWTVEELTHWDIKPICYINAKIQAEVPLNITVYKPPDWVSISIVNHIGPMIEGRQYKLQCDVQNVAPVHLLTVNWYEGQRLVKRESFSNKTSMKPVNKTTTLQITPGRGDDGVQYRCEAELNLGPEGPQPPPNVTSNPLDITVHFGPEFSNCPDVVQLNEGQSLAGYCNVTGNPFPHLYWERDGLTIDPAIPINRTSSGEYKIIINGNTARILKVEVKYGPEISCGLNNIAQEDEYFTPNCTVVGYPPFDMVWYKHGEVAEFPQTMHKTDAGEYTLIASNNNSISFHTLEIDVWYPPYDITELENAHVSIREDVALKCSSNAKPPPEYKWIYHQASNVQVQDQDGVSLLHITRAGGDNIGTYTCIAKNGLGEKNQTVRVNVEGAEPTCPLTISPPSVVLEYGKSVNVTCTSSETNANLKWTFSNMANVNTLEINSTWLIDSLGWNGKTSCHGQFVGLDNCTKDLNVTVYKRPDQVSISVLAHKGPMIEGEIYTLLCVVQNVAPVQFLTVNWYKGQDLVKNEGFHETMNPANITTILKISPRTNSTLQYSCEAELKLEPKSPLKVKSDPLNITVHSKPSINEELQLWVPVFHGYPTVLTCKASGYPKPTITWIFNNENFNSENLTVTDKAGEYTCFASNSVGNDSRMVTVVMKEDYLPLIAGFVALVVVIISVVFICIYSIYYKNTKMGHYTVEGAKPKAQNGNIAQNGKDSTIPMKKIMV